MGEKQLLHQYRLNIDKTVFKNSPLDGILTIIPL